MNEQILAVQRMQDYIEQHLSETITPVDLAAVSLFSPWHSYRLFKEYTQLTPAEYIRRLRLSKSALRLRDDTCKIIDAAFDLGFGSADGYTRAFFREFGCTPKEYANAPIPLPLFTPYGVKFRHLRKDEMKMEYVKSVFIQVVEKPCRQAVIKRGMAADDYNGPVPDGFDIIKLPAAKYLMFQGEPFREEDYCEAIVAVQKAIEKYAPSVVGLAWDTEIPRIQLEPVGTRGYVELWGVREK